MSHATEWKKKLKNIKQKYKESKKALKALYKDNKLTRDGYKMKKELLKDEYKADKKAHKKLKPKFKFKLKRKTLTLMIGLFVGTLVSYKFLVNDVCESFEAEGQPYKICVIESESKTDRVLLFFHGTLGNEKSWSEGRSAKGDIPGSVHHEKLMKLWGKNGPKIITLTLYPTQLELDKSSFDMSVLKGNMFILSPKKLKFVKEIAMKTITEKYLKPTSEVVLMGTSMGGLNASLLALAPEMEGKFKKVLLIAPLMTDCNPFAKTDKKVNLMSVMATVTSGGTLTPMMLLALKFKSPISDCIKAMPNGQRGKSMPPMHRLANYMLKIAFKEEKIYQASKPQARAAAVDWKLQPEWRVIVGKKDTFGFYPSNQNFVNQVKELGGNISLQGHTGGHAVIPMSVAKWVME